jgi:hypothetical protein
VGLAFARVFSTIMSSILELSNVYLDGWMDGWKKVLQRANKIFKSGISLVPLSFSICNSSLDEHRVCGCYYYYCYLKAKQRKHVGVSCADPFCTAAAAAAAKQGSSSLRGRTDFYCPALLSSSPPHDTLPLLHFVYSVSLS